MLNLPKLSLINFALALGVIILSINTIIWHHDMSLLYKQSAQVKKENHKIMALHKQLLTDHSQKISGLEIKSKALTILKMRPIRTPTKILSL